MPKPDLAILFAKTTIYELAHIRASIEELTDVVISDIKTRQPAIDVPNFKSEIKSRTDKKAKKFFEHYVKDLGLEDEGGNKSETR